MNEPARIAKVVPFKKIDQPLDYSIPEEFSGKLKVGMRVLVPLRNQPAMGIVIGLTQNAEVPNVKPIQTPSHTSAQCKVLHSGKANSNQKEQKKKPSKNVPGYQTRKPPAGICAIKEAPDDNESSDSSEELEEHFL